MLLFNVRVGFFSFFFPRPKQRRPAACVELQMFTFCLGTLDQRVHFHTQSYSALLYKRACREIPLWPHDLVIAHVYLFVHSLASRSRSAPWKCLSALMALAAG